MAFDKFIFSPDFQDTVLACIIRYPEKFDALGDLIQPGYFTGVTSVEVVYRLREYYEKYSQWPNFTTLGNYIYAGAVRLNPDGARESFDYVTKLAAIDVRDQQAVYDMVRDFARQRALHNAIVTAHNAQMEGKEVEGGLIPLFEKAMAVGDAGEDMGILLQRDFEKVIDDYATTDHGIDSGFGLFREVWKNGWAAGWLIVPLAPPKRYKTTFCINVALNMCNELAFQNNNGGDVIYYTCEISQKLAATRALCNISGYTQDDLFSAREKFKQAAREKMGLLLGNFLFKGFSSKTATIAHIKAHARKAIKMFNLKPRAIFIDYAETVRPQPVGKDTPDWRQQADIYTQARAMGNDLGCCVIMPDRCKQEFVDRKVPNMSAFQGSFEKAGIVDVAIGLCQTDAEHMQHKMRYFIFLNRHGEEYGHFEGHVDPPRYRLTIEKRIPYNPDDEDNVSGKRRRRSSGQTPDMLRHAAEVMAENDVPAKPKQAQPRSRSRSQPATATE